MMRRTLFLTALLASGCGPLISDQAAKDFANTLKAGVDRCTYASVAPGLLCQAYHKDNQKWPDSEKTLKIYWSEVLKEKIPIDWSTYHKMRFTPTETGDLKAAYMVAASTSTPAFTIECEATVPIPR